jgi:pimeloyl-ACP methyl ester carboxylesterase
MILQYKGINIFYTDTGKGNPVVFLHGFLETSKIWNPFISEISKNNRAICIDLLGHGNTGCLGYIHTMEVMAEAVEAVLKHLEIIESTIIGHSMGGYVALAFAEKNPNALKGLCLMNSTSKADGEERKQNRDRAILAVKQNHRTFIRMSIANLFRPKNRTIFHKEIDLIKKDALLMPLQGIVAALEGMKTRKDRFFLLNTSDFEKMMIASKKDPVLNYEALIDETKNTDVEFIDFPDGHMSYIENKDLFLQAVMYFIEKI